jgi:arylsulfatase A-like enzyme
MKTLTFAAALLIPLPLADARQPNVVVIIADDLGYGDLGCYGATRIKTPEIDGLAKSGLLFTAAYAPASTCTPTRYSLLTGEYPWRQTEKKNSILDGDAPLCIDPETYTLADLFKDAGYQTGIVGKWHLGLGDGKTPVDFNGEIKPGPLEVGFDYCHIIPATVDRVPSVWVENHHVANLDPSDPIKVSYQEKIGDEPTGIERPNLLRYGADKQHSGGIHNGISRIGYQSGGKAARFTDEQLPDTVVAKSTAFIASNKDKPFFLYVGLFEPHVPRTVKPEFAGSSKTGLRGDVIQQADWQVGKILAALDEHKLADDTIVILTSDNGPVLFDGYDDKAIDELKDHRPAGPWTGWKYLVQEGGCRVPFIVRWTAKTKPGVRTQMLCLTDIFATAAKITGRKIPARAAADSINMLPVLLDPAKPSARSSVVLNGVAGAIAFREGDWKLHLANTKKPAKDIGSGADDKDSRFARANSAKDMLFNLAEDPGENHDLSASFPEHVEAMKKRLKSIQDMP